MHHTNSAKQQLDVLSDVLKELEGIKELLSTDRKTMTYRPYPWNKKEKEMNKKMLFRHSRSGEIYEYICSAENTETKTPMVVYTKHKVLEGEPRKIYARPYDSFFGTVKEGSSEIDRFVKIEE